MKEDSHAVLVNGLAAVKRLIEIASSDTGQSRRVADFLLAWHNAAENGGWDPTDLWAVDSAIAEDILAVLRMISLVRRYPGDYPLDQAGLRIERIWELWRKPR